MLIDFNCLIFADDIIMVASSDSELQSLLDRAIQWSKQWKITFNTSKCNIVNHRPKSLSVSKFKFSLGVQNFNKTVDSYRYLGIMIDEHIDFKMCLNTLAQSGTRAPGALIHKNKMIDLSHNTFTTLYNACVLLVITY